MISEPELEGEQAGDEQSLPAPRAGADSSGLPPGAGSERDGDRDEDTEARETLAGAGGRALPARRAALVWALGGALVASGAWLGGLYAYRHTGPDMRGYRVSRNLCLDADLTALSAILGTKRSPHAAVAEDPALDQAVCSVDMGPAPSGSGPFGEEPGDGPAPDAQATTHSDVDVHYTLHRKTDPEPEFDAALTGPAPDGVTYHQRLVPDLGERAYVVTDSLGNTTQLKILDGQAEFTIDVKRFTEYGHGSGAGNQYMMAPADPALALPAVVHDAKELLTRLRR